MFYSFIYFTFDAYDNSSLCDEQSDILLLCSFWQNNIFIFFYIDFLGLKALFKFKPVTFI